MGHWNKKEIFEKFKKEFFEKKYTMKIQSNSFSKIFQQKITLKEIFGKIKKLENVRKT